MDDDPRQCQTNADCARFPGTICDPSGGCVAAPPLPDASPGDVTDAPVACTTTQDCLALVEPNAFSICRKSDHTCVSLLSEDCGTVLGAYKSDEAIFLGAMLPLVGTHQSSGLSISGALRLASEDFAAGLPPLSAGGPRRPLVVVVCDETRDATRAATHLVAQLGVPAIVGAGMTDATIDVATHVAGPARVLLVSPTSSGALDALPRGLVYRTCPENLEEASALALTLTQRLEPAPSSVSRIAIVHKTDAYGTSLDQAFVHDVEASGWQSTDSASARYYLDVDYGDPDTNATPAAAYAAAIARVTGATPAPELVVVLGTTEAAANVIQGIENQWGSTPPPRYLLSAGLFVPELLGVLNANDGLRTRVLVAVPGTDRRTPPLDELVVRYQQTLSDMNPLDPPTIDVFGTANAYDAYYMLAYGIAALGAATPTGDALGMVLPRLTTAGAMRVDVGPTALGGDAGADALFATLAGGGSIQLRGTSGPLDLDTTTGNVSSPVQLYCATRPQPSKPPTFAPSGLAYDPAANALSGTIAAGCTQ